MSFLESALADVFVTSVSFSEQAMEISFLEHREQTEKAAILRNMMISVEGDERLAQAYRDLQELLCEIVDEGYEMIRNPPERGTIREQMIAKRARSIATESSDE